jgi:hypothetical protein
MNSNLLPNYVLLGAALVLAGAALGGCASDGRAWSSEDSWYNAPPPETPPRWQWEELDRARIHEVMASREPQAEELLADLAIVALSNEQAAELLGRTLAEVPGATPYLSRGVYLNRETGGFSVYVLEDRLLVHHTSLGRSAVPMKRQALVLQLARQPADVFVTCSMAE